MGKTVTRQALRSRVTRRRPGGQNDSTELEVRPRGSFWCAGVCPCAQQRARATPHGRKSLAYSPGFFGNM